MRILSLQFQDTRLQILFVYVLISAVSLLTRLRDMRLKLSVFNKVLRVLQPDWPILPNFKTNSTRAAAALIRLKFKNLEKLVISSGLDFDFCVISKRIDYNG